MLHPELAFRVFTRYGQSLDGPPVSVQVYEEPLNGISNRHIVKVTLRLLSVSWHIRDPVLVVVVDISVLTVGFNKR